MKNEIIRNIRNTRIEPSQGLGKNIGEEGKFKIILFLICGRVPFRQDPHLKRCPGSKRSYRNEMIILTDDPDILLNFLTDDVAKNTAFFVFIIGKRPGQFGDNHPGQDRQGDKLGMGMFERGPGSLAEVFKNHHIAESGVIFQILDTIQKGLKY